MHTIFNTMGALLALVVIVIIILFVVVKKQKGNSKCIGQVLVGSVIALFLCAFGASCTDPARNCEHQWEIKETIVSTIGEEGYVLKFCPLCESEEKEELSEAVNDTATEETTAYNDTVTTEIPQTGSITETVAIVTETTEASYISSTEKTYTYVLNTSTNKFHVDSCPSVKQIAAHNYSTHTGTRDEVIAMGYNPCGKCHP